MSLRNCELGRSRTKADGSLEPEVANVHHRWRWVGGAAGAALGYIIGNIPGAVAGGEYGRGWRLGLVEEDATPPPRAPIRADPGGTAESFVKPVERRRKSLDREL